MPDGSATAHLYQPKLATILREGYGVEAFRKDALAAITVAIIALPLSMAIAVASGVSPDRGLVAAIVGGFIVSALGGSRYQIGGPAGAFIVLVSATVGRFGVPGLLVTVLISGLMLIVLGALRLGSLVRHIPHAVTVGFTCGVALTIAASQLKDLGGLVLQGAEPGRVMPKLAALAHALPTLSPATAAIGLGSAALIFVLKRLRPTWPGMVIAVIAATLWVLILRLPVETVAMRFGALPHGLSRPHIPPMSMGLILQLLPTALSFTLLGAIESLLSATVADGMTARRHRSNMELVAQGVANVASALFGGVSVTGTIARTATNIRAGARTPIAGMLHALFLLMFLILAASLVGFVPLAALAGVLLAVCWNMAEKAEFVRLLGHWSSATVLLVTFGLTIVLDLTTGIIAGSIAAALLQLVRRHLLVKGSKTEFP